MSSLTKLFNISIADAAELEQMWFLIINAIDNLEQIARARELTNIIWDINVESSQTEQDWKKTEILLESYERTRDESLEIALSNLRELVKIMNSSNLRNQLLQDDQIPRSFDSQCKSCEQSQKLKKLP